MDVQKTSCHQNQRQLVRSRGHLSKVCRTTRSTLNAGIRSELATVSDSPPPLSTELLGPSWYRGLAEDSGAAPASHVDAVPTFYGVRQIVVGPVARQAKPAHDPIESSSYGTGTSRTTQPGTGAIRPYGVPAPVAWLMARYKYPSGPSTTSRTRPY